MRALAVVLVLAFLAGCAKPPPASTSTTPSTPAAATLLRGVAFSPRSPSEVAGFFDEAKHLGGLVLWGGPIAQLADEKGAPGVIATLAHQRAMKVAIQVSPLADNSTMDADLTASVAAFASRYHPEFLALGVEVNRLAEPDAARFDAFVGWYDATYDAVKRDAPATNVFVTFQYEWMEGHRGGLFGGQENATRQWDLLARFPKLDLAAFTTYPGLVLPDPSTANASYYARLEALGRPVAITETAHFADSPAPGWESSAEEQAAYARWFLDRAKEIAPEFAVWLHAYDQNVGPAPFHHVGLSDASGAPRPARDVWAAG